MLGQVLLHFKITLSLERSMMVGDVRLSPSPDLSRLMYNGFSQACLHCALLCLFDTLRAKCSVYLFVSWVLL